MSLLPLDQGLAQIRASVDAISDTQICDVSDAAGRVLAQDVIANAPVPPVAKSAMDGYAVLADDVPGTLRVSQQVFAGYAAEPLLPGTCARIYTGSVLPSGADTVIMQEDVERHGDNVAFSATAERGNNVRSAGCDIAPGDFVARAGKVLTAADIALLSLIGKSTVTVKRRLVIGVFSTGDELVISGTQPVSDWQLVDSNRPQIKALLNHMGFEVVDLGIQRDDKTILEKTMTAAAPTVDILMSSGGVSVGDADIVRDVIEANGSLDFWRLAIKPGKPVAIGKVFDTPILCLPGNPVSAWMTLLLVSKVYLQKRQGIDSEPIIPVIGVADFSVAAPTKRQEFLRVAVAVVNGGQTTISLAGNQFSSDSLGLAQANGVAIVPIGRAFEIGDEMQVLPISQLMDTGYHAV